MATAEAGGTARMVLYGALWIVGRAQSYRLLDWIDARDAVILRRRFEIDAVLERSARGTVVLSSPMGMIWTPLRPPQRLAGAAGAVIFLDGRAVADFVDRVRALPTAQRGGLDPILHLLASAVVLQQRLVSR